MRITTKFGLTTLLTIHDSESVAAALHIFWPKGYSEVISDDDIDKEELPDE